MDCFGKILVIATCLGLSHGGCKFYDLFKASLLSTDEYKEQVESKTLKSCSLEVEDCVPDEMRRVDGTCNNLQHPSWGCGYSALHRMLPAIPASEIENRTNKKKSKSGVPLRLSREIVNGLISKGQLPSSVFTSLTMIFWVYMTSDVVNEQDVMNYMTATPSCCSKEGPVNNERCLQIEIPEDDLVHRFSGIRCQNLTMPVTFQDYGCVANGSAPERYIKETPLLDLSNIYGNNMELLNKKGRLFKGGLLKYETENSKIWPPSSKEFNLLCFANSGPEKRCLDIPNNKQNTLAAFHFATIWFWRHHNYIANELAKQNPCWDDDKLFWTARDINIAMANQIYLYELVAAFLGAENLQRDEVISLDLGHRNFYDPNEKPEISTEYLYALRWLHTMQNGKLKMFDEGGHHLKDFPITNLTCRPGFLDLDNNIDYLTLGLYRQPCGHADQVVDPDMSDHVLVNQDMSDVFTSDNQKARLFGLQPYVKYKEYCTGKSYKSFHDLKDAMEIEKIYQLEDLYDDVEDIEPIAGMWVEKHVENGSVPETFYCIIVDQLKRFMRTDRHWYERPDRPYAFTVEQLSEIRKATISGLLCTVGDSVTRIQPYGFILPGPGNEIGDCSVTTKRIDFTVFADPVCEASRKKVI